MHPDYKRTRNHLVHNLSYSVKQSYRLIARYGTFIGKPKPENANQKYYDMIGIEIQKNWPKFLNFTRTIKGDYKREFKKKYKNNSYDNWYEESSFDGTFAYSGVADDF